MGQEVTARHAEPWDDDAGRPEVGDRGADDRVTPAPMTRVPVHVIATTPEGTKCALTVARQLTHGVDSRVVLLVPRLTSYCDRADLSSRKRAALVDEHHALAADAGVHVTVLVCVCRRLDDVVEQLLGPATLVIVGGRRNLWWPSREQRLVDRLTSGGHSVVFADLRAQRMRDLASVASL